MEIIQAAQLSDPTLFSTPPGVLSIIAHYSRPNILTFPKSGKVDVTMTYDYTIEGSTIRSHDEQSLFGLHTIHSLIGAVGDNIYFTGVNIMSEWTIYSFSVQTQTFKALWTIKYPDYAFLLSQESMYEFPPGLISYRYDLITGVKTKLPDMINRTYDPSYFLYKDNIYVFGEDCQRFDIKENKWYKMSPMPVQRRGIPPMSHSVICNRTTVKEEKLYLITAEGNFFMYDPEKDTWVILTLNEVFPLLYVEKLQYSSGRFTVVSTTHTSTTIREVDSTTPEKQWKVVLTIEGNHHVHLT